MSLPVTFPLRKSALFADIPSGSLATARTNLGLGNNNDVSFGNLTANGNIVFAASPTSSGEIQRNGSVNNQGIVLRETSTGSALVVTPNRVDIFATSGLRVFNNIGTADGPISCGNLTASGTITAFKSNVSATNFESIQLDPIGNTTTFDLAICSGSAGGSNRGFRIGSKFAGGSFTPWLSFDTSGNITANGSLRFSTDNTFDIGRAWGGSEPRPRDIVASRYMGAAHLFSSVGSGLWITESAGVMQLLNSMDQPISGIRCGTASSANPLLKRNGSGFDIRNGNDTAFSDLQAGNLTASGTITPGSLADAAAANGTIYYSTDQSKLVYKDSGGTVNVLY